MLCDNWTKTKERFEAWWRNDCVDRPMLRVVARRAKPLRRAPLVPAPKDAEDLHIGVERLILDMKRSLAVKRYMAEAYPSLDLNIGPGSMAVYLGAKPIFRKDTVWYEACDGPFPERFDPQNDWYRRHLALLTRAQAASEGEFIVNIPDLIENIDIYAALRGPMNTCYDLMDDPEAVQAGIRVVDEAYFPCYDGFRNALLTPDGICSYTAFSVLGLGRVAKVQCDFSALLSPKQFRNFILPSLRRQCQTLDHSVYHLDGPDAIKHLDALMEIDELQALQWTCGAGQPDSASKRWYPIYDRVKQAGKALHLTMFAGGYDDWIRSCDTLVNRYGVKGMYFLFPEMDEEKAEALIEYADRNWRA